MPTDIQQNYKPTTHSTTLSGKYCHNLEIRLACVEDGIDNTGFRKISAYIKSIHQNTKIAYIPTSNYRNVMNQLMERIGGDLDNNDILEIAQFMAKGDVAAFSSMTQSSFNVYKIIAEVRKLNPNSYIIWGGIHAIIQPEDAIKHADAVCTGEGEFSFKAFLDIAVVKCKCRGLCIE